MQITFSLLALAIAATAMAVVPAPLEVRAATTCDTVVCLLPSLMIVSLTDL